MCAYVYVFRAGLLSSVGNLETISNVSSITISWTAPFSLDVTDVDPDIWYSVLIYNVTDEDNPTIVPCTDCNNITETYYTFTPDYLSPCHKYNFTVIPQNGVGDGQSSENVTGSSIESECACTCGCMKCIDMYVTSYPFNTGVLDTEDLQWHVTEIQGHVYIRHDSKPTTTIMVIVETTEHTTLSFLLNVTSCNSSYDIGSVARVLLYQVDVTGVPLATSPIFVWSSTDRRQKDCRTQGDHCCRCVYYLVICTENSVPTCTYYAITLYTLHSIHY